MTWRHKSVHACIAGAHILVLGQRTAEVAGPSNTSSTSRVSAAAAAAAGTLAVFALESACVRFKCWTEFVVGALTVSATHCSTRR